MPKPAAITDSPNPTEVRDRILNTACALFYQHGVRAIGVDLVVEQAGVAKTSLYRHFKTKDDLIAAFLEREDADFWNTWDNIAAQHAANPTAELDAQLDWIAERVSRPHYRGCPQLNVAAEFPDVDHPARKVAIAHKRELRHRLKAIAQRMRVPHPDELAAELTLVINGALVSSPIFRRGEAPALLRRMAHALVNASHT